MKKKCLSLLLAGAMVLSMASVGMTASAEEDTIRVGMVTDVGGVKRRILQSVVLGRPSESHGRVGD